MPKHIEPVALDVTFNRAGTHVIGLAASRQPAGDHFLPRRLMSLLHD